MSCLSLLADHNLLGQIGFRLNGLKNHQDRICIVGQSFWKVNVLFSIFNTWSIKLVQVEIVMGLEEAFNISVEEESAQNISTVQDAADLIETLVAAKSG